MFWSKSKYKPKNQQHFKGTQEHLEILLDALISDNITRWNHFIDEQRAIDKRIVEEKFSKSTVITHQHFMPNLTGADLSDAPLNGVNFEGVILNGSNLSNANLSGAILRASHLEHAIMTDARMDFVNLTLTRMDRVKLDNVFLFKADLSYASLVEADLRGSNLLLCNLVYAKLDKANLTSANLYGTHRTGWSIKGVICESAIWDEEGKSTEFYELGDFERLYSENVIEIEFPSGIKPYQYYSFPTVICLLREQFGDKCTLEFRSLDQGLGNHKIRISVSNIKEGIEQEEIDRQVRLAILRIEEEYGDKFHQLEEQITERDRLLLDLYMRNHKKQIEASHSLNRPARDERYLAVFVSDVKGFSTLKQGKRTQLIEDIIAQFRLQLGRYGALIPNTWGDAVFASFEDPRKSAECVLKLQKIFKCLEYEVRIGIDYGKVQIWFNEITEKPDGQSNSINFAARLEPLCEPGKVLISEALYAKLVRFGDYQFKKVKVNLQKGVDNMKAGASITAYYLSRKTE